MNELTFAEALRLCGNRGVVECNRKDDNLGWQEFYISQPYGPHVNMDLLTVANFAESQFRRVRPKRSRVQALADIYASGDTRASLLILGTFPAFGETVVRAVCEFASHGPVDHNDIEREFLVPR